ncbi:ribonucleotide-diphosphate reductase subunit beta [Salegentibacter salegens]|uniref:ribonucleoside-diphosphate reductase n=1 Tax=Salegentibacter salegens TaxID=143223 RepID=A0A1M7M1N1_9FLAO|nr:ribonucleotide-diphosphate reductase subunit beta [Salegentibacter salegens]PRX44482.1 ribonucleoside-diphosphate reductase beta chain [Salegentibacter salegens]SHM84547.1 ribonucleoside-diphosphate reductase beta chain [Salegentibacter salegens]
MSKQEPLLRDNKDRFVIFPVKHNDIWDAYKAIEANFWTSGQIDIQKDLLAWQELNDEKRLFLNKILCLILSSEKNLSGLTRKVSKKINFPEARSFLDLQLVMENTHTEAYSMCLNSLFNTTQQEEIFKEIEEIPATAAREEWIQKWSNSTSFAEKLVALATAKSIFSYSSFATIFWIKNCGLIPGLCYTYETIYRDKALHRDFTTQLFRDHLLEEISDKKIQQIIGEAVAIEKEFIAKYLPLDLIGLKTKSLTEYLEYEGRRLFTDLMLNRSLKEEHLAKENLVNKRAKDFSQTNKTDKDFNKISKKTDL